MVLRGGHRPPPTVTYLEPEEHPAEHDQSWMYTVRVFKDTLAAISPELLKKSKHYHTCTHRHTAQGTNMYTPLSCPSHAFPLKKLPLEVPDEATQK